MVALLLPIFALLHPSSSTLNPLNCNGVVFKVQGSPYAYPAGECFGDQITYTNSSYKYYCNGDTVYRAFWGPNNICKDTPTEDIPMLTWLTNQGYGTEENIDWIQECSMDNCVSAKVRTWAPTYNTIFNSESLCESYTIDQYPNSVYQYTYYIKDYCLNYTESARFEYSSSWTCSAVGNGAIGHYYWLNDDCSGGTEAATFISDIGITCNPYPNADSSTFPDGNQYKKEEVTCDVATLPPTPAWTQPVTELPCNVNYVHLQKTSSIKTNQTS